MLATMVSILNVFVIHGGNRDYADGFHVPPQSLRARADTPHHAHADFSQQSTMAVRGVRMRASMMSV